MAGISDFGKARYERAKDGLATEEAKRVIQFIIEIV